MIDPFEIINAPNWGALCVAILYQAPISPEIAAELYEHGSLGRQGMKGSGQRTVRVIQSLRSYGCSWSKITQLTGIKSPASTLYHWRRRYKNGGVEQ